jgi:hypothetical protein
MVFAGEIVVLWWDGIGVDLSQRGLSTLVGFLCGRM